MAPPFKSHRKQNFLLASLAQMEKAPKGFLPFARVMGLEPTASSVHVPRYFHNGMDYIFTMSQWLVGVPVSSLYGALMLCVFVHEVPSVFAYPPCGELSLHRYPGKFQSALSTESCIATGKRSNQLSYTRTACSFTNFSKTLFLRSKRRLHGPLYIIL